MPKPVGASQRYLPGLDGLRAIAVLAVIAYHLQFGWAQGGLLGVGVFFTLSGYLITDLLLGQWQRTGGLQLADFWLRRARRLLPALFLMLAIVIGWVALFDHGQLSPLRGAAAAAAGYASNWWLIAEHSSYFARFGPPSPLGHLWSLAVEEQFYLVWPWLLWLGLVVVPGRGGTPRSRWLLAAGALLLAAVSAIEMAKLYQPGYDPTRVYDGTDTRAFALMIGAALAFVWPSRRDAAPARAWQRRAVDGAGAVGLLVIGLLIWRTGEYSPFLYRGGMVLLAVATAAVVAAVAMPAARTAQVLGWRPLRWIGVRSYGIYLWHFPIIVLTTPANGQETLPRAAAQVAATIGVAALSWRFVEEPIRHGAIARWRAQLTSGGWRSAPRHGWAWMGSAAAAAALAVIFLTGALPAFGPTASPAAAGIGAGLPPPGSAGTGLPASTGAHALGGDRPGPDHRALRSSCRAVVHIGDSTSEGLISPEYLPNPALRLAAQYARVGVKTLHAEIQGATSIVETLPGQENAYMVAQQLIRSGYHGCWVLALGTNDTADVAVGSTVSLAARIQRMMSLIGGQPVMWVNVKSLLANGPYSESNMQLWNQALVRACGRYPNMRVYDWAAAVKNSWYISDGVHFTSLGYAERARLIANALARAFPAARRPLPRIFPRVVMTGQDGTHRCIVH